MNRPLTRPHIRTLASAALLTLSCTLAGPALALYKVVGPDGKVSYTDRAPTEAGNKVQSVKTGSGGVNTANLPYELRQIAERYPVTLYSGKECPPCDTGRQLLRQRGVPYSEKLVNTPEDVEALRKISGGARLPVLSIGSQVLRGMQQSEWASYLDAAGYPAESKLPSSYQQPSATPLTERQEAPAPAPKATTPTPTPSATTPAPAGDQPASKFRF